MAKKRNRSSRPKQPPAPSPTPAAAPAPAPAKPPKPRKPPPQEPARAPVFWFGFELPWAKLAAARIVLFGLLALDAFLQIRHAPRYGAGDFNVGHFGFLDSLGPGRTGYELGQLLETYLFALAALGVATRLVVPIAAAIYAWLYFGSQLDSYQHHYLMMLVVGIACFVPWQRPADATPATPVRSWAVRLLLVQLAVMYLWAAIGKLDPTWLDGRTLGGQLTGSLRSLVDHTVGMKAASIIVIIIEGVLAATIWSRRTWKIAAPLGLVFHAGIAMSGLEIGMFAFLMLGLYLLVLPGGFYIWLAETPPFASLRGAVHKLTRATSWRLLAIAIIAGIAIGALLRLEHGLHAAIAVSVFAVALAIHARRAGRAPAAALGAAHFAAVVLWLVADRASSVALDYYKYWAGSQRRLGDLTTAEYAYRKLVEVAPDLEVGHYHLGRILVGSQRADEGLGYLHEAQRLEPHQARAWIEEARLLATQGKHDEAIAKAREATVAEPSSAPARSLLDSLIANKPVPSGTAEDDAEKL